MGNTINLSWNSRACVIMFNGKINTLFSCIIFICAVLPRHLSMEESDFSHGRDLQFPITSSLFSFQTWNTKSEYKYNILIILCFWLRNTQPWVSHLLSLTKHLISFLLPLWAPDFVISRLLILTPSKPSQTVKYEPPNNI